MTVTSKAPKKRRQQPEPPAPNAPIIMAKHVAFLLGVSIAHFQRELPKLQERGFPKRIANWPGNPRWRHSEVREWLGLPPLETATPSRGVDYDAVLAERNQRIAGGRA